MKLNLTRDFSVFFRYLAQMHSFQQRIVEPQDDTDRRTAFAKLHLLLRSSTSFSETPSSLSGASLPCDESYHCTNKHLSVGLLPDAPEILMALPVFQEILNYLRHPNPDFQTMVRPLVLATNLEEYREISKLGMAAFTNFPF